MILPNLINLEQRAFDYGLLLRLQVSRPLNLWTLRVVVAEPIEEEKIRVLGEMKAWAYAREKGLQLDTMRVLPLAKSGVGNLIWSATMAWALENTPCRQARLLAIHDDMRQHSRLVRYFKRRSFVVVKEVGSSFFDFPLRTVWGGAGSLMVAKCSDVLEKRFIALEKQLL